MAKRSKQTNGIDADVAKRFIGQIENLHGDLAAKRGEYMADCKGVREDIKQVYADAKDAGIPVKGLKAIIKDRALDKRKAALKDGLDIDDLSAFEQMVEALGGLVDTPLGKAALEAAE